jgi:hypothetical protein
VAVFGQGLVESVNRIADATPIGAGGQADTLDEEGGYPNTHDDLLQLLMDASRGGRYKLALDSL